MRSRGLVSSLFKSLGHNVTLYYGQDTLKLSTLSTLTEPHDVNAHN